MMRFVQTSDWQIGMKGGGLGEAGAIVRETRIESIHNVLKTARDRTADFVLLCGDIFEHNMVSQEDVKRVIAIFNQYPDIPLFLLPGNHDVLGADCIYNRPIFQRVEHLTIFRTSDPVEVGGATLYPCLTHSQFKTQDLTGTIPLVRESDGIHIGIAHGSLVGKFPSSNWEDTDLPIDPCCPDRTGIDYLAMGHWHSYRAFPDQNGTVRMAYSGTHEQTSFDEGYAGQCLFVQIDKRGEAPRIEPVRTGVLKWVSKEFEMRDSSSLIEFRDCLESIKGADMVRLFLRGQLPLELKGQLDDMLDFQTTLHKNLRVKSELLDVTAPPHVEVTFDFGDRTLNQTDAHLRQILERETDPTKRSAVLEALTCLRRYAKEAEA